MHVNDATLALIRRFEGLRLRAYRDAAGVWTICYGHTASAGPPRVTPGMRLSEAECDRILRHDVRMVAGRVASILGANGMNALNANQFGALVSFAYNVGIGNFRRSSVLRAVRAGRMDDVPRLLLRWTKARDPKTGRLRTLRGLVRRRRAEGRLWLTPPGRRRPPPVAIVRHKVREMREHPDLAAAWAAFLLAASMLVATFRKELTAWITSLFGGAA